MSTRANIIVTDGDQELIFYRHSDGYPEGAMPTLEKFLSYVKDGRIRDNVGQASGWLILLGRQEYASEIEGKYGDSYRASEPGHDTGLDGWKIGAIEPTTGLHGDIEYLYIIDLAKREIRHTEAGRDAHYDATIPRKFYSGKFNKTGKGA